jgi:hypothetical protein
MSWYAFPREAWERENTRSAEPLNSDWLKLDCCGLNEREETYIACGQFAAGMHSHAERGNENNAEGGKEKIFR